MNARELILLSPYRLPTESTLYLGDEEVAAFLHGYSVLWHPAALACAISAEAETEKSGIPKLASPYDYEEPSPHHLYAIPDEPPLMLPDDWEERAREAGALVIHAGPDRAETFANLRQVLQSQGDLPDTSRILLDLPADQVAPFLGIGFAYLQLETLCEAMSHENLLAVPELWQDLRTALTALAGGPSNTEAARASNEEETETETEEPRSVRDCLRSAAERLLEAREVLYPVPIHLIDLTLIEDRPGGVGDASVPTDAQGGGEIPWPAALEHNQPINLLVQARALERLAREQPERFAQIRDKYHQELIEILGGCYCEREDALLPLESQLWNLTRGQETYQQLLGQGVRTYARQRFAFHPYTPLLLQSVGITQTLLVSFDEAVLPAHHSTVVSWPAPDGKQVEAFTRTPQPAHTPQTWFHLAHYLHETIMHDQTATLVLLHREAAAAPWYEDLLALTELAPVLGRWSTLSSYFSDAMPGDYTSPAEADEFHGNYLSERTPPLPEYSSESYLAEHDVHEEKSEPPSYPPAPTPHPVSWFAQHREATANLYTTWALAALHQGIGGSLDFEGKDFAEHLRDLENQLEEGSAAVEGQLQQAHDHAARVLAQRLVARGTENNPGFLVLNPCSFKRRVALELQGLSGPLPVEGPIKASQHEGDTARVVVEVPALGFAWFPSTPGPAPAPSRLKMADDRCVRNEFIEAEVDVQTGGLRAIRDMRTQVGRLGQQLVFNPGSTMSVREVRTTSAGPALGEIISEGVLLGEHHQVLASFRQRFRIWRARPLLEMRIEIRPERAPEGYPWHAYYGARFAWRDERSSLLRGVNGVPCVTGHTRPETPDFLEVRLGRQNTILFPKGLPFHQRQGGRMLDMILVPPGETAQVFDLAIALDRDYPMQTALGLSTPVAVVPVDRGPPHVGSEGWLFHLDSPNLLLTRFRPASAGDAIVVRVLECSGHDGQAELRCVRNPRQATLQDARGEAQMDATTQGDAVQIDFNANDLVQIQVEF
jgi:hypothetical protein